jgi:hypothetical protein
MSRPLRVDVGGYVDHALNRASAGGLELLPDWPVARPADWRAVVNRAQTPAELEALRRRRSAAGPSASSPGPMRARAASPPAPPSAPAAAPSTKFKLIPDSFFLDKFVPDTFFLTL